MNQCLPGVGAFTLWVMVTTPTSVLPLKGRMESVLPFPFKGESKRSGEGAIGMGMGRKHCTALIFRRSSAANRFF